MRNRNRSLVFGLVLSVVLVVAAMPAGGTRPGKPRDDEVRSATLGWSAAQATTAPVVTFAEAFFPRIWPEKRKRRGSW